MDGAHCGFGFLEEAPHCGTVVVDMVLDYEYYPLDTVFSLLFKEVAL
jgi:hypothetical protein